MDDKKVRNAVLRYLTGQLTEVEAARQAGIPRSKLRQYARTSGIIAPSPVEGSDRSEPAA
jgi:hypothetical protein